MVQQSIDEEDDDAAQGVMLGSYLVDDEEEEVYRLVLSDTPLDAALDALSVYLAVVRPIVCRTPLRDYHPSPCGTRSPR